MNEPPNKVTAARLNGWYDLFSRGARDWLRHNDKIRDAVRERLPEIISGADIVSGGSRTVRVPVRMLEHYHFRLRKPENSEGVGQGAAKPGDVLAKPTQQREGSGKGAGGKDEGGVELTLEFKIDDIVDWLWEEMQLPHLEARIGQSQETDWKREGLDKRGARSRLDRRRSLKEAIKRRAVQKDGPDFSDEDLRFRQLTKREQPAIQAVVILLMDVSGSMSDNDRQLAKTFFFWAVQGLRRQYRQLDTVFVAHTTEAWEFNEEEFFQVSGSGGTVASTGFTKVQEIIKDRFSPSRYNVYLFYASDGDNYTADRPRAQASLAELAALANYCGYLEVSSASQRQLATETGALFRSLESEGKHVGSFAANQMDDIWNAVRHFFQQQARG